MVCFILPMPDFMNFVPLRATAHHILLIEFPDLFLTPEKNFREFIIEVNELHILLLSKRHELYQVQLQMSLISVLLNFPSYCHSKASVFSLHQDSSSKCSEVLLYSPSLIMLSHCIYVLVGWLFYFLRLLICLYSLKYKQIPVCMCSLSLNFLSYTIKIMRTY